MTPIFSFFQQHVPIWKRNVRANAFDYRNRIEKLNKVDEQICLSNNRNDLLKKYGNEKAINKMDKRTVDEFHYIMVMYDKPLTPHRRIMLRKTLIPIFESNDEDLIAFGEFMLQFYDCT